MADSGNISSHLRVAYPQKGKFLDLKAKLKKTEVPDGVITEWVKWLAGVKSKTKALVFDEVAEGDPLHYCGIRDGDELTSVNHENVDCSHDVNHIASVIRDCSPTVILGIKRRRVVGSVSDVVIFQLSDDDWNPVRIFCESYWDFLSFIPFITFHSNSLDELIYKDTEKVEVIYEKQNIQYWLTFEEDTHRLTFKNLRPDSPTWVMHKYYCAYLPKFEIPTFIVLALQDQERALYASKGPVTMEDFILRKKRTVAASGVFLKAILEERTPDYYYIKSTQTDDFLGVNTRQKTMPAIMSRIPTPIQIKSVV